MNDSARERTYQNFVAHDLDGRHKFHVGQLPENLRVTGEQFEALWILHPAEYHRIMIHGRLLDTPRWQKAYLHDYEYTGNVNQASLELPPMITPILAWAQQVIDQRLNGALLNWYEGGLGHYIGAHRDSREGLIEGSPIVTISLGQARVFRLRPWKEKGFCDIPATDGTVFIMPWSTNLAWTHEVPHAARHDGRRVSVTFRAFQ